MLLLSRMLLARLPADVISFNAAISACQKRGKWETAVLLLFRMCSVRVAPDMTSFDAAICACEGSGNWQAASALILTVAEGRDQSPALRSLLRNSVYIEKVSTVSDSARAS